LQSPKVLQNRPNGAPSDRGIYLPSYAEWASERLQRDARGIGPATEALIIAVMARRPHPEQGFRTCLRMLRLFRGLEASRVEAASNGGRDRRTVLRVGRLHPKTPAEGRARPPSCATWPQWRTSTFGRSAVWTGRCS
jgi:hypothetical protein